jgi:hypothetical protein
MTDHEKLIAHLRHLDKSNAKVATIDVKFLLNILTTIPTRQEKADHNSSKHDILDVDGGSFYDNLNS